MIYTVYYNSPVGQILLASRDDKLIGLWIEGQKYYLAGYEEEILENRASEVLVKAQDWLDRYFRGEKPGADEVLVTPTGSKFQQEVWRILRQIPYGKVMTYGDIAKKIAASRRTGRMSAQAVGGAVGRNPISIIVPCHRVVGADGSLTGYAGGLKKKMFLLRHEGVVV